MKLFKGTGGQKRPGTKSLFRRINDFLHLWLGLISGLIVFVVSITGCIYVFEKEIRELTEPYQTVAPQAPGPLLPSQIAAIAEKAAFGDSAGKPGKRIQGLAFPGRNKAVIAGYPDKAKGYTQLFIDPYTGKVLHKKVFSRDFFRIVLMGHYYLWLPPAIGQPIVAGAVLIFLVLLLTGLIMWFPKNFKRPNLKKSFSIKWRASFKRVNYDLHNVFGFYVLLIAFVIAATGLVWSYQWFARTVYWTTSAGKKLPEFTRPSSDTTARYSAQAPAEDRIFQLLQQENAAGEGSILLQFPQKNKDPYAVFINPSEDTYYKRTVRFFDRNTMQELKGGGVYGKPYEQATFADKVTRMNYDIHVGAILGLPGKILACLASLICASLPITGFLIWLGRKKKQKRPLVKRRER